MSSFIMQRNMLCQAVITDYTHDLFAVGPGNSAKFLERVYNSYLVMLPCQRAGLPTLSGIMTKGSIYV